MEKPHPKHRPDGRLGQRIRSARLATGKSLMGVAREMGISKTLLSAWENSVIASPDPDRLIRLAQLLEIEPGELLELAGYDLTPALPSITPYLRSKYQGMPQAAQVEITEAFERIAQKYGYDPSASSGPVRGQDE